MRILVSLAAALLLAASTGSFAQQKFKYYFKAGGVSKYTEQHALDVGDVTGHQIRVAAIHTKYANEAPEFDGVKVVETFAWLASDYVVGSGHATQYAVYHMANGDKIHTRTELLAQTSIAGDGGRRTSYMNVTTLVGGTGKFATIRGTIRGSGVTDFKTGASANPSEGEYWFDKPLQ